jgi:hypothetical protein
VLSGRGLCDGLITRPEESYRLWSVVVYDLETSRMKSATRRKHLVLNQNARSSTGRHIFTETDYLSVIWHVNIVVIYGLIDIA